MKRYSMTSILMVMMLMLLVGCGPKDSGKIVSNDETKDSAISSNSEKKEIIDNDSLSGHLIVTYGSELYSIDIATGVKEKWGNYKSYYNHEKSTLVSIDYFNPTLMFDSNLSMRAIEIWMEDGSRHVGWVDADANIMDVSAKITSDTDKRVIHKKSYFGPDNYFYFLDESEWETNVAGSPVISMVKRVAMTNLSPDAVETVFEFRDVNMFKYEDYISDNGVAMNPLPDGSISSFSNDVIWFYYDKNMSYPALGLEFSPTWINSSVCVNVEENGDVCKYTLSGKAENTWYNERLKLGESVHTRPMASPNADKIAFVTKINNYGEGSIYIVSLDGQESVKVPVEVDFDCIILAWLED